MAKANFNAAVQAEPARKAEQLPVVFSKSKALTFRRYANRRDLLSVLLKDGETYTTVQVDDLIEKFMMKGKVN